MSEEKKKEPIVLTKDQYDMLCAESNTTSQLMRDLNGICEKLNELGRGDFMGQGFGWRYEFKRIADRELS